MGRSYCDNRQRPKLKFSHTLSFTLPPIPRSLAFLHAHTSTHTHFFALNNERQESIKSIASYPLSIHSYSLVIVRNHHRTMTPTSNESSPSHSPTASFTPPAAFSLPGGMSPALPPSGWGTFGQLKPGQWRCKICTLVNPREAVKCFCQKKADAPSVNAGDGAIGPGGFTVGGCATASASSLGDNADPPSQKLIPCKVPSGPLLAPSPIPGNDSFRAPESSSTELQPETGVLGHNNIDPSLLASLFSQPGSNRFHVQIGGTTTTNIHNDHSTTTTNNNGIGKDSKLLRSIHKEVVGVRNTQSEMHSEIIGTLAASAVKQPPQPWTPNTAGQDKGLVKKCAEATTEQSTPAARLLHFGTPTLRERTLNDISSSVSVSIIHLLLSFFE